MNLARGGGKYIGPKPEDCLLVHLTSCHTQTPRVLLYYNRQRALKRHPSVFIFLVLLSARSQSLPLMNPHDSLTVNGINDYLTECHYWLMCARVRACACEFYLYVNARKVSRKRKIGLIS